MISDRWEPIDMVERDGKEILASDLDYVEIVHWDEFEGVWRGRNGDYFFPSYWQALPGHPSPC